MEDTPVAGAAHCGGRVCCLPLPADGPVCGDERVLHTLSGDIHSGGGAHGRRRVSCLLTHTASMCGERAEQTLSGATYGGRVRTGGQVYCSQQGV